MGPDGSGFQSCWAFLAGTRANGCFLISEWELFAYFHSCDNSPVMMEDSVPVLDMPIDGTMPRVKSGVGFTPALLEQYCTGESGGSCQKADSDSVILRWGLSFCISD